MQFVYKSTRSQKTENMKILQNIFQVEFITGQSVYKYVSILKSEKRNG
jgi:hypothetical protein